MTYNQSLAETSPFDVSFFALFSLIYVKKTFPLKIFNKIILGKYLKSLYFCNTVIIRY